MRIAAAIVIAAGLTGGQAFAGGVAVPMDEVRTVAFAKPVATVYVGNPAIADINMIDARHAFVLGKSYGTTNIIALDNAGRNTQTTLSCTGQRCEAAPRPGDARFTDVMGDVSKHQEMGVTTK
jgi:Flp pilus assembly secretin CpaC